MAASKFYIRIVNDDAPAPFYFQRIDAKGKPLFTSQRSFAKRYETLTLAEEIAAKLRSMTTEQDGESTTIEIIDTQTDKPVGEPEDEPEAVCPPPVPPFKGEEASGNDDGWVTRFSFFQACTGLRSDFQMKKTSEGLRCRYTTMQGAVSPERPKSEMKTAVANWTDCLRAWLCYQIDYGGGNNGKEK